MKINFKFLMKNNEINTLSVKILNMFKFVIIKFL